MKKKILLIEDDEKIGKILSLNFLKEGYSMDVCIDGEEGLKKFNENIYSMVLLDLMLPKISGREVCKNIRNISNIPIIVLTAKQELFTKIDLLDIGADDYLTKPFEIEELFARMRVLFRNKGDFVNRGVIRFKDIEVHQNSRKIFINKEEIKLTKKEFNLLEYFIRNKGLVLSREKILNDVWGWDYEGEFKIIDIYINSLRKKISQCQDYIKSVRGVGYILEN
nr:response regulator transcription factor [uncultured Cetobacterium sp.]